MGDIVKHVLDFLFNLIVFWKQGEREIRKDANLTAVYDMKRAGLEKNEIALLELLEDNPGKEIRTAILFNAWNKRCQKWFGVAEGVLSEGEVRSTLKDWSNDEHPLVLSITDSDGRQRWKLNPEYDERRTKRPPEPTVFREPTKRRK